MTSARENFEHNQLMLRREEAYSQLQHTESELKKTWQILRDLDQDLRPTDEQAVRNVSDQMGKIGFLQSSLDDGLTGDTEKFAKEELATRLKILEKILKQNAEYRGDGWKVKLEKTKLLFELQEKIPKLQAVASGLDYEYFRFRKQKEIASNSSSAKDVDEAVDEITVEWLQEQGLVPDDHETEREIWDIERQWYEISDESKDRAIQELKESESESKAFEKRMKAAMKLEVEIERTREKLTSEVANLTNVQQFNINTINKRLDEQRETFRKLDASRRELMQLNDYFEDIVPDSVWPDFIVGKPKDAYDPAAAQVFQDTLQDTLNFDEYREFFEKQTKLKELSSTLRPLEEQAEKAAVILERFKVKVDGKQQEVKDRVVKLREELNMLNGRRAAELQVALPRIRVLGEEKALDYAEALKQGKLPEDMTDVRVPVKGVQAMSKVTDEPNIVEASATATVSVSASAKANVYRLKEENDEKTEEVDAQVQSYDALQKHVAMVVANNTRLTWKKDIRSDPEAKQTDKYKKAIDMLNILHEDGDLVEKTWILELPKERGSKVGHLEKMLAWRCGFILHKDKEINVQVLGRGEPDGNAIHVLFPKSNTTGLLAVYPNTKTGSWIADTALHVFEDWVEIAMTTPGVPSSAKVDPDTTVHKYLEYFRLIEERIETEMAISAESQKDKKKANG